jgi:RNA polymerase primary sigma factor
VSRAVADQSRTIRVPVHMHDQIQRFGDAQRKLTQDLGHEPTLEDIANTMGISAQRALRIQTAALYPLSLETPIGDEEDASLGDLIEDRSSEAPTEAATRQLLHELLNEVLTSFNPREERILKLRFGLDDGQPRTLEEVGRKFGLTRERIRQIEAEALRRLRHPRHVRRLRDFLR